ncbi:MAG: helix-turn-helix transcriptional regulator [Nanoarchaeota archaeon]|nr:helix-turn-helix transcriptional regulator [Nanoarchaeota archaeon]
MGLEKNRLKEFRVKKGLSQKALGDKVGVSRQTIISIEQNRYVPSLPLALKLSKLFGCRVEDLFDV